MLHLSYLMLYKYVSMAALLVSNSMFLFRLQRKPRFLLRFVLCTFGFIALVTLFPPVRYTATTVSFMYGCFFLFSVLMARICYSIDWKSCLLCAVAGYSTQHIASIFYSLITTLGGFEISITFYSNEATELNMFTSLVFCKFMHLFIGESITFLPRKYAAGKILPSKVPRCWD